MWSTNEVVHQNHDKSCSPKLTQSNIVLDTKTALFFGNRNLMWWGDIPQSKSHSS